MYNQKNIIGVVSSTYAYYDLENMLEGISNAGFKYVELASILFPGQTYKEHVFIDSDNAKKSAELCDKYGITIIAICAHGRLMKDNAIENFKKCINTANELGVSYVCTGTGNVRNKEDKKRFYKEISVLGEYAANKNINICLEIHDGWFCNGKIATEVVKKIGMDNIKINYDTANVIYYGNVRPEEDIKNVINENLGHVHLKDKRGGYKIWDFPPLGEGEIDFEVIFNELKNYSGTMCVEIEFDGKRHQLKKINNAVKNSYEFLKSFNLIE